MRWCAMLACGLLWGIAEADDPGLGAGDWPHLRGPQVDGTSDEVGLADAWPAVGPPVVWVREIGTGYSGFSVVGDRVFTQGQSLYGQFVYCLDADTGRTVWEHRYGWPYDGGGMYPGPRATPTFCQDRIYFAGPRGVVGCLQASDGTPLWSVNVNERFVGRGTDFGYSASPLVQDGLVILPVGGVDASIVALAAADGSTVWTAGKEPASYCGAVPISLASRKLVAVYLQNSLAIVDVANGQLLWQTTYSQGYDEHAAWPVYREPYLAVMAPFRSGAVCYRLERKRAADGRDTLDVQQAWSSNKLSNDTASSVLVGDHIYGFNLRDIQAKAHRASRGEFTCLSLETGDVAWQSEATGHATVLAADGKLILFNDMGQLLLVRSSPAGYDELARTELFSGEICWTAPALGRGRLFVRSPTRAACVDLRSPESQPDQGSAVRYSAAEIARQQSFDWHQLVGGEREFPFDPPTAHEYWVWYRASLWFVLLPVGLIAVALESGLRWLGASGFRQWGRLTLWLGLLVWSAAATPVLNRFSAEFIFTWPATLAAALQSVVLVVIHRQRKDATRREGWTSAVTVGGLLAVALVYFHLCRKFGMAMEWAYLTGLLLAFPLAVIIAMILHRRPGGAFRDWLGGTLCFSGFFWLTALFLHWWVG